MSKPSTELVLFDLDGTLYLSTSILPRAYQDGIRRFNEEFDRSIDVPEQSTIMDQVGNPAQEIYAALFPSLDADEQEELGYLVLERLAEIIRDGGGQLVSGVPEGLSELRGRFPLGLVTNARVPYMEAVVETHGLNEYFERMRCIGMVDSNKKETLVRGMLEAFDVPAERTVMIGDRQSDFEAAKGAGTRFIGCEFGYSSGDEFPEQSVVDSFSDLLDHPHLSP